MCGGAFLFLVSDSEMLNFYNHSHYSNWKVKKKNENKNKLFFSSFHSWIHRILYWWGKNFLTQMCFVKHATRFQINWIKFYRNLNAALFFEINRKRYFEHFPIFNVECRRWDNTYINWQLELWKNSVFFYVFV